MVFSQKATCLPLKTLVSKFSVENVNSFFDKSISIHEQ